MLRRSVFRPRNMTPEMKTARTGLAMEKRLYLAAQKRAADHNQSFAQYVIDLIALDLTAVKDAQKVPDVKRVLKWSTNVKGHEEFQKQAKVDLGKGFGANDAGKTG
jgi:hypothetical protein